jgi:large subunit ribosomal protein L4
MDRITQHVCSPIPASRTIVSFNFVTINPFFFKREKQETTGRALVIINNMLGRVVLRRRPIVSNYTPNLFISAWEHQKRPFKVQKNAELTGVKNSEFIINKLIKKNPTALPLKDPESLHRAALEKALSKNIASGRKTVDLDSIRPVTPSFMQIPETWVKNWKQEFTDLIKLNPYFFNCEPRKDILHAMVVWQLAKRRQGTAKTKYRTELAYSKRKIYQQKGTGRARHGDRGAPQFRGGGHAHPKRPRDFSFKLNKKVRRLALRMALTTKYQQGKLIIVEDLDVRDENNQPTLKTKIIKKAIENLSPGARSLLIIGGETLNEKFEKGSFVLHNVDVLKVQGLNVYDILRRDILVLTRDSLQWLDTKYAEAIRLKQ